MKDGLQRPTDHWHVGSEADSSAAVVHLLGASAEKPRHLFRVPQC